MNIKKTLFLTVISVLLLLSGYFFITKLFKSTNEPLTNKAASHSISSKDLIHSFKVNEKTSTKIYEGKIIEVTGLVEEINFLNNKTTIILKNEKDSVGIICEINDLEKEKIKHVEKNKKIRVKGICKGYLKDVILLNCSIELPTNE